jgi:hypothetical protein
MNSNSAQSKVTLSLPASVRQRLDQYATSERRSRSNAAAVLLAEALRVRQPRTPAEEHCRA